MFSDHWTLVLSVCVEGGGSIQVGTRVTLYVHDRRGTEKVCLEMS